MTFQQAMAATSRELNARATITCVDAFVISNTPVISFSVEEGGQVTLGSVTSSRYTLSLPNGGGEWFKNGSILGNRSLTGARVQIQIGVYHDGAWDWQNAGLFIVEKASAPEHGTAMKLIGNDPIISLDRAYDDQLAYRPTTTLSDILTHIKSKGVAITGSLACNASAIVNFQPDWGEEPTIRDVLGYVLQMGGSFARCDRAGNITLAPANGSTTHAITTDKYTEFTDDERYFDFNRIKILPNGAKRDAAYVESYVTSAAESAANTLCLEGNPMFKTKTTTSYVSLSTAEEAAGLKNRKYYVKIGNKYEVDAEPSEAKMPLYYKAIKSYNTATLQAMADGLKTALTGMSFRAITFKWRGDPTVLVGDKVTLTDTRGVSVTTVILQQSLRYEGGFSAEISCPIDLTAVTPATLTSSGAWTPPYFGTGTIDGSVIMPESITGDLVVAGGITAEKIASKTVTADEIAAKTITADEIKAGTITADEIGASQITATHIGTNEIVANAANIKDGVITNAKIANATIETAKIKDAQITNAKIAAAGIDFANIKDVVAGTSIFRQGVGDALYLDRLVVNDANFASAIAGKLMIRDTDGKLYRISVNSSGAVTATQVQVNGDSLTDNAVMSVSQRLLWRQATAPSAPWIGMLWHDTTLDQLKRCLDDDPLTWEIVPSGAVHTSVIDVDDTGMTVATSGILNLLSGASLTIKALGDTANIISMDNTGLTLSSTGQLKLQSTDSIIIGGSPFSVGGMNLIRNSDYSEGLAYWSGDNVAIQIDSSVHHYPDGGAALVTSAEVGAGLVAQISAPVSPPTAITPSTPYALSFWLYGTNNFVELLLWQPGVGVVCTFPTPSAPVRQIMVGDCLWSCYEVTANTVNHASLSSPRLIISLYGADYVIRLARVKLSQGNQHSPWAPHPKDPAAGVRTSSVEVNSNGIYMDTTGEISMNSGTALKMKSGTVQIEAGDASDSRLQFGDAFSVGKDSTGNYTLALNSKSDDAIKVNGKAIWSRGNLVVQQAQPASGKQTVWVKPNATTSAMYQYTIVATNTSYYTNTGSLRSYALAAQSGDTMGAAGTYSFSVTMTFKRFGGTGLATYNTTGGTVQLKKGGNTLTLSALPALSLKPWAERTVTVTGSTTSTAFTSATGDITCEVTVTGAKPYDNNDFLAHGRPSDVSCAITGPGGAAAQACQVFYVP